MKKIIVLLLAVAFVFSACGGTETAEETTLSTAEHTTFCATDLPTESAVTEAVIPSASESTQEQTVIQSQTYATSKPVEKTTVASTSATEKATAVSTTKPQPSTTVRSQTTAAKTTAVTATATTAAATVKPTASAEEKCGIILGVKNVRFGCNAEQITSVFGAPTQTVTETTSGGTVIKSLIYASDYRRFCVFQLCNSAFSAFYTVADDAIVTDGENSFSINAGGSKSFGNVGVKAYTEPDGKVYAFYAVYGDFAYSPKNLKTLDAQETLIFHTTNALRAINGVGALENSEKAESCIRSHCNDMAINGYLAHQSLDGRQPHERAEDAGIDYRACGENLYGGNSLAFAVVDGWYNSMGHRKNLLDGDYEYIGIAAVKDSEYGIKAGQLFYS